MTLTQQDFTSENLRELEQDAERLAASLEQAANELRVGVIDVGLSQVSRDLAEFVRAFDSAAKAVGSGTRSLDDLRKALDRRQGRSTLERALRIQGTVAVDLDAVGTVVQAALDDYPPQPEIIAAIEALLALIEDPELDFQRKMALGEQAGRILQKDVVLAAQLGGLTLAVALPEVVLSVDSSQEPLSTDPDPSPPAPEVDEAPQDVGSILNPYRRPELPKEPRLVSSASVAEFKKLKQAGKLSKPTLAPVAEAQSASGDAMTLANAEIMVSNRLPFLSRKTVGRQSPMKSRPHRRLREIRSNPKFRRPNLSSKRVWMRMSLMGLDLWVYWIWLPARKKDMQEQRFLITNRRRHQNTVHRVGRRRWKIEALFKTLKSRFALGKFGQKTKQGVLRFLCLSFACFLLWHLEFISQQESGSAIAEPDWGELAKRVRYKLFGWVRLIELEHERLEILAVLDEEKWVAA